MNFDINHLVRSGAIALVGLPLALSTSGLINTTSSLAEASSDRALRETETQRVYTKYGDQLAEACIGWAVSKVDSKLERESKNTIDEVFGGEVNYKAVCDAFVF
tara:strand:+ start:195 stop:506 length:312 start_codon:yes stop_codon:yes gene_type:complete